VRPGPSWFETPHCAGVALSFQLTFSFNSMLADEFASHLNELARADQGMLK
jgi:hypothetical protein